MSGRTINIPTPNKGLNYVDSITNMDPSFCIECVNFFPTPTTLQLRLGYDILDNSYDENYSTINTLIVYEEVNSNTRIFKLIKAIDSKYYIVDSSNGDGIQNIANFQISSNIVKYIVNNNLFKGTNRTQVDATALSSLVLGVYTKINTVVNPNTDYIPFYQQNGHWGNYHVVATKLKADNTTDVNPFAVPINAVTSGTIANTLIVTINPGTIYTTLTFKSGQIILLNYTVASVIKYVKCVVLSVNGFILTVQPFEGATPTNPSAYANNIILERVLMYDSNIMSSFKPIALTQIAGYTAFIFKDSFHLYLIPSTADDSYSGIYAISGQTTITTNIPKIIPYGYNVKTGGYAVDIEGWTVDSGSGQEDYLVIFVSTGEIIVYGIAGGVAGALLVSTYKTGEVFAPNCSLKLKGDLIFLSKQGLDSMNSLVGSTRVDTKPSLTFNISYQLSQDINNYGYLDGWDVVYYQVTNMLIINIPTSASTSFQYVMNTTTGAWTKFTNINAICFGQTSSQLYFANSQIFNLFYKNGQRITYDVSSSKFDIHTNYPTCTWDKTKWNESVWDFPNYIFYQTTIGGDDGAYFKQAFTKLGNDNRKKINLVKPNIYNYSLVYDFELGMGSDYVSTDYTPYDFSLINPKVGFLTPIVYYQNPDNQNILKCKFNSGYTFGAEQISISNAWFNLPAFGFAFSFQFKIQAYLNDFDYTSTDIVYENSTNII